MKYEEIRQSYRPDAIKYLLIAESPPPAAPGPSSRRFYDADYQAPDDRLYANTMRAVFPEADQLESKELEAQKAEWLERFKAAGFYMIEALEDSQVHEVTKRERQVRIGDHIERLIEHVRELASPDTKLILIKSNVFEVAAGPLRATGFNVLNTELLDYPGRFNQGDYRTKLAKMIKA